MSKPRPDFMKDADRETLKTHLSGRTETDEPLTGIEAYSEAITRGLSDAEAREEGWPSEERIQEPGTSGVFGRAVWPEAETCDWCQRPRSKHGPDDECPTTPARPDKTRFWARSAATVVSNAEAQLLDELRAVEQAAQKLMALTERVEGMEPPRASSLLAATEHSDWFIRGSALQPLRAALERYVAAEARSIAAIAPVGGDEPPPLWADEDRLTAFLAPKVLDIVVHEKQGTVVNLRDEARAGMWARSIARRLMHLVGAMNVAAATSSADAGAGGLARKIGQCGCTIHEDRDEPCGYVGTMADYQDPLSQVCDTCMRVCWGAASAATVDVEGLARLRPLSAKATPGPWIRKWASLDVHHMAGDDALQAQADIDFAVAACAYVRARLQAADEGGG